MTTIDWNGVSLLLEQVRPPAGHNDLGLRPQCAEVQQQDTSAGSQWWMPTEAGDRILTVYPRGITTPAAHAYMSADGLCETGGSPIGVIPLAQSLPPDLREQGYSHNQVPQSQRLAVESVNSPLEQPTPTSSAMPLIAGVGIFTLLAGAAGIALYRRRPQSQPQSQSQSETKEPSQETPSDPTPNTTPPKPPSDFDALNHNITELMGRINQQ